jgi:uncharacterized protein (TIGR00369 family)
MSAIIEPTQSVLERTRHEAHPLCIVCGRAHGGALGLRFSLQDDGSVEARFDCEATFQGYEGMLHGGIASALLDGAMTNCLFARGVVAVTAELTIRFRRPVEVGRPLIARARVSCLREPLHVAEAELIQDGEVKATAIGKFMERPAGPAVTAAVTETRQG